MEILATIWFALIAVLWTGYLFLDGFDLGVGMLMQIMPTTERQKRVLLNTIGPVWDGNEVWLVTAVGAMFAAFPHWYASLLSALYIPLTLCLFSLIFRAVAIEYRGKGHSRRWIRVWTLALAIGSAGTAFCIGAMLVITTTGLPLNTNGDLVGGAFAWFGWPAVLGGVGGIAFCLVHGLSYLTMKTAGPVAARTRRWAQYLMVPAAVPFLLWFVLSAAGKPWLWALVGISIIALLGSFTLLLRGHERSGRAGFFCHGIYLVSGLAAVFCGTYPVLLPSTLDPLNSLTVATASSSDYTLSVMLTVTVVILPIIIGYQIFSYRMFRGRLSETQIPEAHRIPQVIGS